jgi:hypothetical protein
VQAGIGLDKFLRFQQRQKHGEISAPTLMASFSPQRGEGLRMRGGFCNRRLFPRGTTGQIPFEDEIPLKNFAP